MFRVINWTFLNLRKCAANKSPIDVSMLGFASDAIRSRDVSN